VKTPTLIASQNRHRNGPYMEIEQMWNRSKDRNRQVGFSFPDLPPDEILIQQFVKIAQVDRNELERAQWFWKKRPSRLVFAEDICSESWETA
jgi:hypothetical protein